MRFVSPTLFRATLKLPANIPNGVHTVRAFLFKSGVFVGEQQLPLRVVKTGIEQAGGVLRPFEIAAHPEDAVRRPP